MDTAALDRRTRSWQQVAEEQDGVLGRQQSIARGLTEDAWQWRLDTERWRPVLPGVVVTHSGDPTARQRAWAAVVSLGTGAALSGDAALVEHGLRLPVLPVLHVALPEQRRAVPRVFPVDATSGVPDDRPVRVEPHRVRGLDALRHPVRLPPVVRVAPAPLHAAAWAPSDRAAEWRVAAAVQQRLVLPTDVRAALAVLPRLPRRRLVAAVLDDVELGAHAASELDLLRLLRRHGLPRPDQLQRPVRTGRLRYLDAWWQRQRVCAEWTAPTTGRPASGTTTRCAPTTWW